MSDILPYCVYRLNSNPLITKIVDPVSIKGQPGEYTCHLEEMDKDWVYEFTFYAINPTLPIFPAKTELLCCQHSEAYPYGLTKIQSVYDRYNQKKCVYFITYYSTFPNTIPIYVHINDSNIYVSLDPVPPKDWEPYVDVKVFYTIDTKDYKNVPFRCINSICIPWTKDKQDVLDLDANKSTMNLGDCVMYCSELNPEQFHGKQANILQIVQNMTKSSGNITNVFKKVSDVGIAIIIGVLVLVLILTVFYAIKQKR